MNIIDFLTVADDLFNPRYWESMDSFLETGFFCIEDMVPFD